jgi:hypothetical protein
MKKIFKVTLKTTNALKDTAQDKIEEGKYLELENGAIFVQERDLNEIFEHYNVEVVEYMGLFYDDFRR